MGLDITGIGSVFDFAGKVIDKIFPDPAQRDAVKLEMYKAQQTGELQEIQDAFELQKAQIGVNAVEAANPRIWVSGARPFAMWVGGFAFAYCSLIEPIMRFIAVVMCKYSGPFPVIDTTMTLQVLFGLLGLGYMRSQDKKNGTASK